MDAIKQNPFCLWRFLMQSLKSMFKPVKNLVLWLILGEESNCSTSGVLTSKAIREINFGQWDASSPTETFECKAIFVFQLFTFFRKGEIVPQVLRKRKGPDEEEESKMSDISTNLYQYQTWASTKYRRQQKLLWCLFYKQLVYTGEEPGSSMC